MNPAKKPTLAQIFAILALFFLSVAAILLWTDWQRREEVVILNSNFQEPISKQNSDSRFQITDPSVSPAPPISPNSPIPPDSAVLGENEEAVGKINVNIATLEELDAIPGVGPKTAEKIISGRAWENVEDVLNLINKRWREEARGLVTIN